MVLDFVDAEQFGLLSEQRLPVSLQPLHVAAAEGQGFTLRPGLAFHRGLTVTGGWEWLPVRPDGRACFDQMVHTPRLFLGRSDKVRAEGDRHVLQVSRVREVDEDVVLVGGSINYYHWLVDHLPRLLLAREHGVARDRRILLDAGAAGFELGALQALGLGEDQVVPVPAGEAVRVRGAWVPNLLAGTTVCHPAVRSLLLAAFVAAGAPAPRRRIYLSRADAGTRRLENEDALTELLQAHGFERMLASDLGFRQQVDLFASAEAVVAVHGAGMANTLFCPQGMHVFEIFTPEHPVTSMKMIARIGGLRHALVPATVLSRGADGNPLLGDWRVDLDAMRTSLAQALPARA